MILDLKEINETPLFQCDLCIIGSGAAGLALTSQMINTPFKVMLIERGGLDHEDETQALYEVEINGLSFPGATEGRFRVHGGSTTKWGGQALPFTPIDFEKRAWVSHSGWPITYDDLKPYYQRAYQFLMVDEMNVDSDLFEYLKTKPPAFDRSKIWYHFSKWSPKPNIRENYLFSIKTSNDYSLLLHANVTNIILDKNQQFVCQLEVASLIGTRAMVKATYFVLCTGGIETARLLLSNHHQQSSGIGNDYDLVGRFFQDHPTATIGWLNTSNPKQAQRLFNVFHKCRLKYTVRCTASPEWQRNKQTLNMSTGIEFVQEHSSFQDLKEIYNAIGHRNFNRSLLNSLFHTLCHPSGAISPILHYLFLGRNYSPGAKMRFGLMSEQEPNPDSCILLSNRKDVLGMPLAEIRWKLTELTRYSMQQFALMLRDEIKIANIGELKLESWLFNPSSSWTGNVIDQFHHMGTTRMHDSPRHGVVNRHCRVHGISNLFIGSSAVFPTSGHSNPTLTIIALCIRLADRLKQELK